MAGLMNQIVASPLGTFAVLAFAAWLEVYGDACFSSGLYHASGGKRLGWFVAGAAVLVGYSLFLNSSRLDFGKLLGIYVVLFFVVAQLVARFKFGQSPTPPIYVGGGLIVAGGLVMTLRKAGRLRKASLASMSSPAFARGNALRVDSNAFRRTTKSPGCAGPKASTFYLRLNTLQEKRGRLGANSSL